MYSEFLIRFNDIMLATFNKEALGIFGITCATFFVLAGMLMTWASKTGELKDLESAKYEMMDT